MSRGESRLLQHPRWSAHDVPHERVKIIFIKGFRQDSEFSQTVQNFSTIWILTSSFKFKKHRSRHWRCSVKKGVFKNFTNLTGKHLSWSLFFIKLQGLDLQLYQKESPPHVSSLKFAKVLRTPILNNICKRLLLKILL